MNSTRKREYKYCQHCDKELNVKRFKEHERLYFNKDANTWMKETDASDASDQESDFSCFDGIEGLDLLNDIENSQENCEMEDLNLTDPDDGDSDGDICCRSTQLAKHKEEGT